MIVYRMVILYNISPDHGDKILKTYLVRQELVIIISTTVDKICGKKKRNQTKLNDEKILILAFAY